MEAAGAEETGFLYISKALPLNSLLVSASDVGGGSALDSLSSNHYSFNDKSDCVKYKHKVKFFFALSFVSQS